MKRNKILLFLFTFVFVFGFSVVSFAKEDYLSPISYENAFDTDFSVDWNVLFPFSNEAINLRLENTYVDRILSTYPQMADAFAYIGLSDSNGSVFKIRCFYLADGNLNECFLWCNSEGSIPYYQLFLFGNCTVQYQDYTISFDQMPFAYELNTVTVNNINSVSCSYQGLLGLCNVPIYHHNEFVKNGVNNIEFTPLETVLNVLSNGLTDLRGSRKAEQSSANHLYLPSCDLKFITNSSGTNASGRDHDLIKSTSVSLLVDYGSDVWQSLNKSDYSIEITCTPFANSLALSPIIREYAFNGNYVLESVISLGLGNYSYKLYNDSVKFDSISYRLCSPSLSKDEKIVVSVVLVDKDGNRSGAFSKTFKSGYITDTTDTSILDNTNPYIKGDDETIDYNQVVTGGSSGSVSNGITINNSIVNNSNDNGIDITWSPEDKDSAEHVINGIKNGFGLLDRDSDVFKLFRDLLGVLPAPILLIVGGSLSCVTVITIVKIIRG